MGVLVLGQLIPTGSWKLQAQEGIPLTVVRIRVVDEHTKEPVFAASVGIPGTTIGGWTDENGEIVLRIPTGKYDSFVVVSSGYASQTLPLPKEPGEHEVVVELEREAILLQKVVVRPREDPAVVAMRNVWKHRRMNNMENLPYYAVETHNRMELDLTNLTREAFKKYRWLRPFEFVLDAMDTTSYVKPFLPVFLVESISDFAYQRSPRKEREYIRAVQMSGVKNATVTEYLGGMYQRINIYKNWISIFDVDFASPLHPRGFSFYDYEVVDTIEYMGFPAYRILFRPARKGMNLFQGEMIVLDSFWAVGVISMEMAPWARINFVNRMSIYQKFQPVQDAHGNIRWVLDKDKIIVDFVSPAGETSIGFIGRRTTTYRKYRFQPDSLLLAQEQEVMVAPHAYDYSPEAWDTLRHEELEHNEKMVYWLVDTIQEVPQFRTFVEIVKIIVTGYKEFGKLEIGPYFSLISSDEIEGIRIRLGIRTTEKFSERVRFSIYGAYGFRDRNVKYGGDILWIVDDEPWTTLQISARHDLNLESDRWGEIDRDNILALGLKRPHIPQGLIYQDIFEVQAERATGKSWTWMGGIRYARYTPTFLDGSPANGDIPFPVTISTAEWSIALRFAWQEKFIRGKYIRVSLGSKYPIITATFTGSVPGFGESQYRYYHLRLFLQDNFRIKPKQRITIELTAGKIFTQTSLPFVLTYAFPGNWTYYYNSYAFNLMAPFEFIATEYLTLMVNYQLRGYFLHRIPLIRKLDLREFATFKAGWGRIDSITLASNRQLYSPLAVPYPLPYMEVGAGIENILKIMRILVVWRLTYLNKPQAQHWGVFGSFYFTF